MAAGGIRVLGRRAPVPRPRRGRSRPLPRATHALGVEAGVARAELRLLRRPPPAARSSRSGRPASGRRLRADRLQDRGAATLVRRRRPARPLPARRPGGLADRGRAGQLLVRAGGRARPEGAGGGRCGAGGAPRARGRSGARGPGLRPSPLLRDLLLVRLPPDLPRFRGLIAQRQATALAPLAVLGAMATPAGAG